MLVFCLLALLAGQAFGRSKIINGEDASVGQFPHQGSLRLSNSHNCGCSLISADWAVTAAHCIQSSPSAYGIYLGSIDRTTGGDLHTVVQVIFHSGYDQGPGAFPNDVGVMRLTTPANLDNPNIAAIQMAEGPDSNFYGQSGIISGWGYTTTGGGGILPQTLKFANIEVMTRDACTVEWGSNNVVDGHICITSAALNQGSCNGDSGGPLVVNGLLVGATSWGVVGCYTTYPSVYTSIPFFREWIRTNSGV